MSKLAKIKAILKQKGVESTLLAITKWGNLTEEQISMLLDVTIRQVRRYVKILGAYEYGHENKGLRIICYKSFPYSSAKLFCATALGVKTMDYVKEIKKEKRRIVKVPVFQTKFNFYETEHTTWCIKALIKHLGKNFGQKDYLTPRDMSYSWINIYKNIKDIWSKRIEARKPDLLIQERNERICIEIEHMPKSTMRMLVILRSLMALGDFSGRWHKTIIYANDKNKTFNRWKRIINWAEDKPKNIEIRKLSEIDTI